MNTSPFLVGSAQRTHRRGIVATVALAALLASTPSAEALVIDFNGGALTINDNLAGDTNATVGIIDFSTTIGGYTVVGTVDTTVGPSMTTLLGSPTAALRLTNFTATAIGAPPPLYVQYSDTAIGTFTAITAADSLDAYVGHATGAPVPPNTDLILDWQGFFSGVAIPNLLPGPFPHGNPNLPPASVPLAYPTITHGPQAFPGVFVNPVLGAYLTFQLGANDDQFILYTSADVGYAGTAVPEPGTFVLMSTAGLGIAVVGLARRRRVHPRRGEG